MSTNTASSDSYSPKEVGERITGLRRARRMSQDDLAQKMGVSRSAVAQWETGRARMVMKNYDRISEVFGVSKNYIISGHVSDGGLNARERKLIMAFRGCARPEQDALLRIISGLKAAV